jgi:hypothetical protein
VCPFPPASIDPSLPWWVDTVAALARASATDAAAHTSTAVSNAVVNLLFLNPP